MAVTELSTANLADGPVNSLRRAWKIMDHVYTASGYLAAFCMFMIFALTMVQIVGRYVGFNPPGLTNYAGYLTGATTFLGLAHTLNRGGHVRVTLFLTLLGRFKAYAEFFGLVVSAAIGGWFAWYCWRGVFDSYKFGDLSEGLDATPLWIPQMSMAVGATLLAVAVCDHLLRLLVTGETGIAVSEEPV